MRPKPWNPPIELSKKEQKIVKLIKRAKLFVFLREIRHVKLGKGVAKNRRIAIEDEEMRHGWKGETAFIYL